MSDISFKDYDILSETDKAEAVALLNRYEQLEKKEEAREREEAQASVTPQVAKSVADNLGQILGIKEKGKKKKDKKNHKYNQQQHMLLSWNKTGIENGLLLNYGFKQIQQKNWKKY